MSNYDLIDVSEEVPNMAYIIQITHLLTIDCMLVS